MNLQTLTGTKTKCGFCVDGVIQKPDYATVKGQTCPYCQGTTIPGGRRVPATRN